MNSEHVRFTCIELLDLKYDPLLVNVYLVVILPQKSYTDLHYYYFGY